MNFRLRRALSLGAFLLLFPVTAAVMENDPAAELWRHYNSTVSDAAVYKHENLRRLFPLRFDAGTFTATVVTVTNYDYTLGQQSTTREVWVTAVPEVQQRCKAFTDPDLELRLRQLLGLQPDAKEQFFVTMTVRASDIFRPAANPITTTEWPCADHDKDETCGEFFPTWAGNDHIKWVANQMLTSYIISDSHNGAYSYPWTRLGYTYDWKPGADRYGASEYVIRPGSVINILDKKRLGPYCGRM